MLHSTYVCKYCLLYSLLLKLISKTHKKSSQNTHCVCWCCTKSCFNRNIIHWCNFRPTSSWGNTCMFKLFKISEKNSPDAKNLVKTTGWMKIWSLYLFDCLIVSRQFCSQKSSPSAWNFVILRFFEIFCTLILQITLNFVTLPFRNDSNDWVRNWVTVTCSITPDFQFQLQFQFTLWDEWITLTTFLCRLCVLPMPIS